MSGRFALQFAALLPALSRTKSSLLPETWGGELEGFDFRPPQPNASPRCKHCREWPDLIVSWPGAECELRTCTCGFEPVFIQVIYEEKPIV